MKAIDNKELILALEELEKEKGIKKEYLGNLKEFNQNEIVLETEEQEVKIERKNISQIKTVYNW